MKYDLPRWNNNEVVLLSSTKLGTFVLFSLEIRKQLLQIGVPLYAYQKCSKVKINKPWECSNIFYKFDNVVFSFCYVGIKLTSTLCFEFSSVWFLLLPHYFMFKLSFVIGTNLYQLLSTVFLGIGYCCKTNRV